MAYDKGYRWNTPLEKALSLRFKDMYKRCYNPHYKLYSDYGGRGIKICDVWLNDRRTFVNWGISNGFRPGLSLLRKDINKGYAPDNCFWASPTSNANNKRSNVYLSICGLHYSLTQWAYLINRKASLLFNFRRLHDNDADLIWYVETHWKRMLKSNPEECQCRLDEVNKIT